jgi:hypothetical protein
MEAYRDITPGRRRCFLREEAAAAAVDSLSLGSGAELVATGSGAGGGMTQPNVNAPGQFGRTCEAWLIRAAHRLGETEKVDLCSAGVHSPSIGPEYNPRARSSV